MAADWDSVYGTGYFASHVLGNIFMLGQRSQEARELCCTLNSATKTIREEHQGRRRGQQGQRFKVSVYN
jgi:hypothetical protein